MRESIPHELEKTGELSQMKLNVLMRIIARLLGVLLIVCLIHAAVIAFPQTIFTNSVQSGAVSVYFDGDNEQAAAHIANEAEWRVRGSGYYDSTFSYKVFLIHNQFVYEYLSTILNLPGKAQGFALSLTGDAFISPSNVLALGNRTGRTPKFSIWEGDTVHTVAHELGHLIISRMLGRNRWKNLPHWKQEGLPEYVANIAAVKADSTQSLSRRYEILQDDGVWSRTAAGKQYGWDRIHYEAELLVEYLIEIRGLTMEEIASDGVTKADVLAEIAAWTKRQQNPLKGAF